MRDLNDRQFGSCPRRNALDPVLIEELQFEISRASQKMLVQTNYDATAFFGRIISNLVMMVSKKYGIPPLTTVTNATTLQQADYRIRTDSGVATTGYKHSDEWPIYGTGQGSGNLSSFTVPLTRCRVLLYLMDSTSRATVSVSQLVVLLIMNCSMQMMLVGQQFQPSMNILKEGSCK